MGGGVSPKRRRRPHEPDVFVPEGSALLSNLEAHARTVQSSCHAGLDCLPLPRSARRQTKGQTQRNVQARALHERGRARAPSPAGASSAIAQNNAGNVAKRKRRRPMGLLANPRYERLAQALALGKTATEAYALAGYKANDGNASRLKGNERISARVQEIVGRAADRAEVSLERVLRELKAIAFSNISKAVTWRNEVVAERVFEEGEKAEKGENCGEGVKALMPRVTL